MASSCLYWGQTASSPSFVQLQFWCFATSYCGIFACPSPTGCCTMLCLECTVPMPRATAVHPARACLLWEPFTSSRAAPPCASAHGRRPSEPGRCCSTARLNGHPQEMQPSLSALPRFPSVELLEGLVVRTDRGMEMGPKPVLTTHRLHSLAGQLKPCPRLRPWEKTASRKELEPQKHGDSTQGRRRPCRPGSKRGVPLCRVGKGYLPMIPKGDQVSERATKP